MDIKRILIPIAQDETLDERFEPILSYTNNCHAGLTLLHVIDDLTALRHPDQDSHSSFDLLSFAEERQNQRLATCAKYISTKHPGIQLDIQIMLGKAFLKIIEAALQYNSDLIVIDANRGKKKYASQFGSTTRHLMRKSKVPVWTISKKPVTKINSIVAAVDVAAEDADGLALNHNILQFAAFLAKQTGAELTICHAWQLYGESYLKHWAKRSDLDIAERAKQERGERMRACLKLLNDESVKDTEVAIELIEGQPELVLPDYIHENNVDLLVMGTVCRTGLPGVIIGNTAESMLDAVNCSVVTLKPGNFQSPRLV